MPPVCKKSSGVITEEETPKPQINKEEWVGVAVFADFAHGRLHPVTLELLGKAQELAAVTGHPVYALLLGSDTQKRSQNCCATGPTGYMYTITRRWLNSPLSRTRMLLPILLKT